MTRKILVVDDEAVIRSLLKRFLSQHGFAPILTDNGSEALILARESKPDLILTDSDMPGLDGHSLCRVLRQESATARIPVILMSGKRVEDKDIIAGYEGGVDDYVLKPFSLPVLAAKINAVLARYQVEPAAAELLKKTGIVLDGAARTVKVKGKKTELTRKEFDLLAALIAKAGKVLSVNYLLETVWGYDPADYNDPGTVEVHVSHLRKKLGSFGKHVVNVPGHGYKFE